MRRTIFGRKAVALVLAVLFLSGVLMGCSGVETATRALLRDDDLLPVPSDAPVGDDYYTYADIKTLPTYRELEERGVTAEDVLALYDTIAMCEVRRYYLKFADSESDDDFASLQARFWSIKPDFISKSMEGPGATGENHYELYYFLGGSDNTAFSFNGEVKAGDMRAIIPFDGLTETESFETIAESFGKKKFEVTEELHSEEEDQYYFWTIGRVLMEGFEVTREDIENANQELLLAYYRMAISMISHGEKYGPSSDALSPLDYLVEDEPTESSTPAA